MRAWILGRAPRYGDPAAMATTDVSSHLVAPLSQGATAPLAVGAVPNGERPWALDLSVGVITDQQHEGCGVKCEGCCRQFVVMLPYRGHFSFHVGREELVGDPNQVVFLTPGDDYRMSSPLSSGHAELIIRPHGHMLADLLESSSRHIPTQALFRRGSRRAPVRLQTVRARFLHWASRPAPVDPLEADELMVDLLTSALDAYELPRTAYGPHTARLIRRAKEFLEAEFSGPIRLKDVGEAVGASPTYLTDLFRRMEGVPLHQYLTHLRLARALIELPHADDLTALALNLGFSSHAHFTAAFRRRFDCTPSQFRQTTRVAAAGRV
jgi:AraC family transcriptional regulator